MAIRAKFTEQVVVMVTPTVRQALDKIAEDREVSIAQVVREAIDSSLPEQG